MAVAADLHPAHARTACAEPMRPSVIHPHIPSSQRLTLAGKSTPSSCKTAPSTPDEHAQKHSKSPKRRHATGQLSLAASNAASEKEAPPEAIDSVAASGSLTLPHCFRAARSSQSVSRLPPPLGSHKRPPLRRSAPVAPPRGYPSCVGLCGMAPLRCAWKMPLIAARQGSTTISFGALRGQS